MTKPKPKLKSVAPAPRQPLVTSERMVQAWHTHPKLTLATVGAVIAILTSIAPFVTTWYSDFVRHAEFNAYKEDNQRIFRSQDVKDMWRDVRAFRMEATVARNRVNDCNVMKERQRGLTQLERAVCDQYAQDLADANRRAVEAQAAAAAASGNKDRP